MSKETADKVINKDTGDTVTEETAEDISEMEEAHAKILEENMKAYGIY